MVEVDGLTKRYGDHLALNNVSFSVKEGEILGFLGPNGAGKSTTMNILTGYLSSNSGTVKILGFDIMENPIGAKKNIGYLPEVPPLYPEMTVISYLKFIFGIKKIKLKKEEHITEIMANTGILEVSGRLIKNLSKGYKQRVGLAGALIGDPKVVILDEPTVGLDPKQIIEIRNLIKDLKKKHTVIFSSHILSEVQSVCDRVLVINKGKIVANDTTNNLSKQLKNKYALRAIIEGKEEFIVDLLKSIEGVECVEVLDNSKTQKDVNEYKLDVSGQKDIRRDLFFTLSKTSNPLLGLESSNFSLEEIFLKLVENDSKDETSDKKIENNKKENEDLARISS
ncbi:MAG: ABC transporter ATP-binding protein [Oscillospiraceae bacterium]|nr:ABC transporter ATP-binding protein [Oscillospiraceae bacterium]